MELWHVHVYFHKGLQTHNNSSMSEDILPCKLHIGLNEIVQLGNVLMAQCSNWFSYRNRHATVYCLASSITDYNELHAKMADKQNFTEIYYIFLATFCLPSFT